MKDDSCCDSSPVAMTLACSGGSNVGQITNEVAKRLDIEKLGRFFCLAGIGGHVSGIVESVKESEKVLVLDGCPVACAKCAMDEVGLENYDYVVVTDLGIEKKRDFELPDAEIDKVLSVCREKLRTASASKEDSNETELVEGAGGSGSCCSRGDCCCG